MEDELKNYTEGLSLNAVFQFSADVGITAAVNKFLEEIFMKGYGTKLKTVGGLTRSQWMYYIFDEFFAPWFDQFIKNKVNIFPEGYSIHHWVNNIIVTMQENIFFKIVLQLSFFWSLQKYVFNEEDIMLVLTTLSTKYGIDAVSKSITQIDDLRKYNLGEVIYDDPVNPLE
jgi:hypothetical protein